jgi:hypothetical protein
MSSGKSKRSESSKRPREAEALTIDDPDVDHFDFAPIFDWGNDILPCGDLSSDAVASGKPTASREDSKQNPEPKEGPPTTSLLQMNSSGKLIRKQPPVKIDRIRKPLPTRSTANCSLYFADFPQFQPNLTPKEVLQRGSFGGSYFRPFQSTITGRSYEKSWQEFPTDWFEGLSIGTQVASAVYNPEMNFYKVACADGSERLKEWEDNGWITDADPYGWFQWYCRFYLGRRCSDDARQITRALGVMGESGRWRRNLINKCVQSGLPVEEATEQREIAPKIRQLLQHWGYQLTVDDLKNGMELETKNQKRKRRKAEVSSSYSGTVGNNPVVVNTITTSTTAAPNSNVDCGK